MEEQIVVAQVQPAPAKKMKPARKQVMPGQIEKKETPQTGKEYNIWYNKWAGGDREDSYSNKEKAPTRCNIRKDSGYTRADAAGTKYCCLFFARGQCPYGSECQYLHRLPPPGHELPDTSKDCFGRDKFADYRDDMGGVGSFSRQNRTLYIGRIKETGPGHETEEVVRRHFKEWGEIEKMRVLQYRSVAFVTYVHELSGQFAKEAMACQSLDNDEILNVRWATEDPNPTSKVSEKRRLEEQGQQAIANKLDPRMIDAMRAVRALEDGEEVPQLPEDEEGPQAKRLRLEGPDEDMEEELTQQDQPLPPEPKGLLSPDTLEGMKYFAEIRKRHQALAASNTSKKPPPPTGLSALGGYGSDDDD
ncbi:Pre-mRNA-splicing factor [Tulasnella sp. JGI-2019a]|nr:Pre-mRNA-splicing factor [Tulasnella sp. JGI-2019a]KAG9014902.1 Pre-mRNA-splicing factor [Tulasnella sp. JGI-2019a]